MHARLLAVLAPVALIAGPGLPGPAAATPVPWTVGDCSDYVDLSGEPLPIIYAGSTAGADDSYGPLPSQPACWENTWRPLAGAAPDVTFKWTCPATGRYTLSLAGSSYDTCLFLFDFTCPDEPLYPDDYLCGNEDTFVSATESELFAMPFVAGQEILIVVDGFAHHAGDFLLTVSAYTPAPDLDAYILQTMSDLHVPGVAACGIVDDGIAWSGAYGHADLEHDIPVTDETLFVLASISKPVTGTALEQLAEEGAIDLDLPVDTYLPITVRNPSYPVAPITARQLMTHTSGIHDSWTILDTLVVWGGDSPLALRPFLEGYLTPGGAYHAPDNWNDWPPGERYEYSNVGATLAGYLVESVSGRSLEAVCQDSIFAPLGMDATSWYLAGVDTTRLAVPYDWDAGAGVFVRYPHWGTPFFPASQLRTSAPQLAHFLAAFMQCGALGDARILECSTVAAMTSPQIPSIEINTGLFWYRMHYGGRFLWGHAGAYYGCRTHMFYAPAEGIGAVVLTNGEDFAAVSMIMHEVLERVAPLATGVPPRRAPVAGALALPRLEAPGPLSASTRLLYELPRAGRVGLAIHDVLGRRVATLVDGFQGPGRHTVTWGAGDVATGIYFARLECGGLTRTVKVAIVR